MWLRSGRLAAEAEAQKQSSSGWGRPTARSSRDQGAGRLAALARGLVATAPSLTSGHVPPPQVGKQQQQGIMYYSLVIMHILISHHLIKRLTMSCYTASALNVLISEHLIVMC